MKLKLTMEFNDNLLGFLQLLGLLLIFLSEFVVFGFQLRNDGLDNFELLGKCFDEGLLALSDLMRGFELLKHARKSIVSNSKIVLVLQDRDFVALILLFVAM